MQLSRLAADVLTSLATRGFSNHTVASYEYAYRQLVAFMAERGMTDDCRHLSPPDGTVLLLHWQDWMKAHGAGPNTIRARVTAITALVQIGALLRDGRGRPLIEGNPLFGLPRPGRKKPGVKALLPAELRAFCEVPLGKQNQRVVRSVLLDTGLRVGELSDLNVGQVLEVAPGVTRLHNVRVKGHGGGRIIEWVPLSPAVADELRDWLLERGMPKADQPLFLDESGRQRYHRQAISSLVMRIGKKAGITRFEVTPHVIRHTLEGIRRRARIDGAVRSALLTHSNPASIAAYTHVETEETEDGRRRQVERMKLELGYDRGICEPPNPGTPK
jgi:integrase